MGCVWGAGGGAGGGRREAGGVSRGRRAAPSCGVPSRRASSRRSSAHRGRQQRRQVSPALLDVPTDYGQGIDPPARLAPRAARPGPSRGSAIAIDANRSLLCVLAGGAARGGAAAACYGDVTHLALYAPALQACALKPII